MKRYVLKQHLLKLEVIYPEESEVLGYFKNEPVYSRTCVHTLHTHETWLKEARLVRRGEKPYKTVKGRRQKGQTSLEAESNTAEVFGLWQTKEYYIVVNTGIAKVARKLGIDYAPAMMGWDHHGGYCHPIIEGIVVAEEYQDTLMEAWTQEQQLKKPSVF